MSRASSLFVALVAATAAAETLVNQQPNPHTDTEGACAAASFADLLEVPHLAPLATQTDTFVGEAAARTPGGARVRLYNFKQRRTARRAMGAAGPQPPPHLDASVRRRSVVRGGAGPRRVGTARRRDFACSGCSTEYPRLGRGAAATRLHRISTSHRRRRRDSSPVRRRDVARSRRNGHARRPRRLSAAELPFSVAPVAFPRDDPRLLVASAAHADSWFPGYAWEVVGARTPCGFAHLGWRFANAEGAFLALIVRPSDDEAAAWAVGNPATAALAALFLTTSARGASL